jgi:predicted protein tyrosine phosphatase
MILIVCPLSEADKEIAEAKPARVLSLLSPEQQAPWTPAGVRHLVLRFHDVVAPTADLVAPDEAMIKTLLDFGGAWREPESMLAHCWMGISRSPAAALALACALRPERDEHEVAWTLRLCSPTATPNSRMIALADACLERNGRLIAAGRSIGRGAEAACGRTFRFAVG